MPLRSLRSIIAGHPPIEAPSITTVVEAARVMKRDEITVRIDLKRGDASATVWTCDLSTEYVKINADYRS